MKMSDNKPKDPVLREYPEETICPSCGKFVGAYARCPYCGTKHTRRISIRFFRLFSLGMAFLGVFLVWLAARGIKAPLIKIDEIQPTMAFAYVRVEGECVSTRVYDDGGVGFRIDDGTGTLPVRAYRDIGEMLLKSELVPSPGDKVSAEGTLQLREDFVQMIVNVPEKVRIVRASSTAATVSSLDKSRIGDRVVISGTIVRERRFGKGGSITVRDGTGSIDVVIWDSVRKRFGEREKILSPGNSVSVRGKLGEFRDKLQLYIDFPGDVTRKRGGAALPPPPPAPEARTPGGGRIDIDEVTRDRLNTTVEIIGEVSGITTFSKGRKLQVMDPTGSVEVLIWNSLYDRIPDADDLVEEGALLKVRGRVGEYRDTIQVVPKSPGDVTREEIDD